MSVNCKSLLSALYSVDPPFFNDLLYEIVRWHTSRYCNAQVNKPVDGEFQNTSEPNESEFNELKYSLFLVFEAFIAGVADPSPDALSDLEKRLNPLIPGGHTICGHILQQNEPVYSCSDCAVDPTCVLCRSCFFKSIHVGHSYKMHTSMGGGYCDCGDVEAWRTGASCTDHIPAKMEGDGGLNVGAAKYADPENAVDSELESESHSLRKHFENIPQDVLVRTSRLLEPLIRSSIVCLCDLLQATHPFTTKPVSSMRQNLASVALSGSHSVRDLLLDFHGTTDEPGDKKGAPQLADDLWPCDDNVVNESAEIPSVIENWPPPISHIPLVSPALDASQLGEDSWPRTAPKSRAALDIEQRALAQLSRARRLHPRLFPPRPTRTASERTAASHSFVVVLHNNEYHNYEQVIKTLRRVLVCTTQQATHHAVVVNRDGRSVLQTNLGCSQASKIAASLMRTSTSLSTRPLHASCEHSDIYSMSVFFTLLLRWITHLSNTVPSLRPVICHALLGFFVRHNPPVSGINDEILPVVPHGEAVQPHSWLDAMIERHCLTWRAVRSEALHVVMSVLLRESFYRRVFAIHFTRVYSKLLQQYLYDDHTEKDNLYCLSCQVFTVISLARHLLERNNVLSRMLLRLEAAFEANSLTLPEFYSNPYELHQSYTVADDETEEALSSSGSDASWFAFIIDTLRRANPFEWGSSSRRSLFSESRSTDSSSADDDFSAPSRAPPEPRVLHWQAGTLLHRARFHPFERLLEVVRDISYVLGSLTNVRPLCGDPLFPKGWWNAAGRSSFLDYIRSFLRVLSYIQDMSGMQRETRGHVADDTEWASGLYIINHLVSLLGLTVQVASSDYQLFKDVLSEARQAFEYRVGIMDRRFRVAPLPSIEDDREGKPPGVNQSACSRKLSFQSLGATTEVYAYDVATYRVSLLQPLPRFLASLYGHGVEMGLSFDELGLQDKAFANLLIERPLQILAFCAQYNAKMWVRNGYAVQTSIANLFATGLRVELIERDFQLLQLAAAVIPPDEFIVRMIHKMQLQNYLDSAAKNEPAIGRVQAAELLLRTVFTLVTDRSRPGIGQFSTDYLHLQDTPHVPFNQFVLDPDLEIHYASLIDAVIHTLCLKAMSCSQLLQLLPYQPIGCLLKSAAPPTSVISISNVPISTSTLGEDVRPASISGKANRLAVEQLLPRILRQIATESTINGRTVFAIKPEVIVGRFMRFHWGYRHAEQTMAESYVSKCLKKWLQEDDSCMNNSNSLGCLPLPPPAPRPIRRFTSTVAPGLLGLIRCPTFVRLLRALLDIAVDHGTSAIWWSDALLDLVLHLIQVALYEDELEHNVSGSLPFLDAVARVPVQCESKQELEILARRKAWLNPPPTSEASFEYPEKNCLTQRLVTLLQSGRHEDHMELLQWTLNQWNVVMRLRQRNTVAQLTQSLSADTPGVPLTSTKSSLSSARQQRAEMAKVRRAKIMERMSNMQRSFMSGHVECSVEEVGASESHPMEVDEDTSSVVVCAPPTFFSAALGPDRVISMFVSNDPPTYTEEMLTCNLCLEDVPATSSSRMVFAAHVCRSSVISSPASSWCEGPRTTSHSEQAIV